MKRILLFTGLVFFILSCSDQNESLVNGSLDDNYELKRRIPDVKIPICCLEDEGVFHLIEISSTTKNVHLEHGDGYPGQTYAAGYELTEDCQLIMIYDPDLLEFPSFEEDINHVDRYSLRYRN